MALNLEANQYLRQFLLDTPNSILIEYGNKSINLDTNVLAGVS